MSGRVNHPPAESDINRAVGDEIRRVRDAHGWTRTEVVSRLPSGVGDRSLLSYEAGTRPMSVYRLVEVTWALNVESTTVLKNALQRLRAAITKITLSVDLNAMVKDVEKTPKFRPMLQWALNARKAHANGVVDIAPEGVRHLALCIGYSHADLAKYLAKFPPKYPME